jgi:Big-like domain-containing protein
MRGRFLALGGLLVSVAIVLAVLDGGGGDQARVTMTRGVAWTGSSPVTESVARISARGRAEDRRNAGRPLRIRAKPEPGEESAEAAAQPATEGQDVREKPEPGESGQPKRQGRAGKQQRTGAAAIGPSSSFTAGTSFLGAQVSESGFIPPDSMGAVGPTQILVDVNGRIKVFDKQGNLGGLNVTDASFWSSVRNGVDVTDPGVEYDRLSGRWIVSAVNLASTNNRVMIAVSSGPTITDSSSFTFFFFNQNGPSPAGTALFADYPQLGVDNNAIYIGDNEFTSSSGSFVQTSLYVIRKSSVTGGGPIVVTPFRGLAVGNGSGPESPQPATNMDSSVASGYVIGPDNAAFNQLDIRRISDPGGTPSISGNLTVSVPSTSLPLSVPASGSHKDLDALDDRLFEAMIARAPDGTDSLWTAHNIRVNSSGVGTSSGDRDADRWYQIGNLSTTPTLTQSGTLFDTAASNPRFFWMPSVAANGQGHMSLNSSMAGSGRFAEVASSGHLTTDPTGTTEPFDTTQTSSSSYNLGSPNPQRWGDYSQTVVDPTDNQTFWTFQEYANATNSWGVRAIKEQPPPPATPSTATPDTIAPGQASVSVQVAGTQVNGSGFFDPGVGFPNHIGASVSGGVTVNSVTYTDPTHVTLNLNTTSASNGSKDITVTNPDGQSSTGFNALVVGSDTTPPAPPTLNGTTPASPSNNNSPQVFGAAEGGSTVNLYDNSSCSGPSIGSGTAAQFASPGITVSTPVPSNSTTTFYATATDLSDNTSACSSSSVTYVEDSTAPAAPTLSGTTPASPANNNNPAVTGSAEAGTTISLYRASTTSDCTSGNLFTTGTESEFESPGLPATVLDNTTTTFRATATDPAGNTSGCSSSSITYVEDSFPPAAPSGLATAPASPANDNGPEVSGSAEAGSTVKLYTDPNCTGAVAASGPASTFSSPGLTVSVANNTTTTFRATATDQAANTSACSSGVTYVEDSSAPVAPSGLASSPASPANDNNPEITGSAEAGSTVKLYAAPTTADCTLGNLVTSGGAATFASPGLTASVGDNTTTVFRATATDAAGNTSPCSSSSVSYTEDSTLPGAPVLTGTSPVSPGNTTSPKVIGTADTGSTVKLYTNPSCTNPPAASGSDATLASPGITAAVSPNSTTSFHATSTDASNNTSACSPGSVTYVEDATPPTVSIDSGPSGLTNDHTPTFTFSSTDTFPVGDVVTFQCSIDQGTVVFGACSGPGASHTPTSPLSDGVYTFRVRGVDQAGNVSSAATRSFTVSTPKPLDSIPPETTITKGPKKKTTKRRPKFKFTSSEFGSRFQCKLDAGQFQPCTSPFKPPKLRLGKHKLRVEAIDPSGNVDPTPAIRKFRVIG